MNAGGLLRCNLDKCIIYTVSVQVVQRNGLLPPARVSLGRTVADVSYTSRVLLHILTRSPPVSVVGFICYDDWIGLQ